jgi:hypothetical protein
MILNIELIDLKLQFKILDTPLAELWLERMANRTQYPLDNPDRFYGFDSQQDAEAKALAQIQQTCAEINSWNIIVEKSIESVHDQDTLNYLHNVFECWHGLLDQVPEHPVYGKFPDQIRWHLANLNVDVHRCESVSKGNRPRFVCTWYGLPKTKTLPVDLMQQYGTLNPKFGSVCLNYVEIGKTVEDLTQDNDNYISDKAFRPFTHYSADFNVRLYEETVAYSSKKLLHMQEYYNQHQDFFFEHGYTTFQDPRVLPLRFPVAQLIETTTQEQLLADIQKQQCVTKVYIE